jgi:hypothetical protein
MPAVWPTEPVEASGVVTLWGGWSLTLPRACMVARNEDGSWSAWDATLTIDVHIVETAGHRSGRAMPAEEMLGEPATVSGDGWIGVVNLLQEPDDVGPAWRLAVTAAAENTLISCWVAFRNLDDRMWGDAVVASLRHRGARSG